MLTIPAIEESLEMKDRQIGQLERQCEALQENICELRRQLGVDREPAIKDGAGSMDKAVNRISRH